MGSATRLERWESRSEWALAAVAFAFLIVYSVQVLAQPSGATNALLNSVMTALYVIFVVDYLVRLTLAPRRVRWFFRHLLAEGIYWPPSQFEAAFVSLAHSDDDIQFTIRAVDKALSSLRG